MSTAREIVEALTRDQVRQAALLFVEAVAVLDENGNVATFLNRMREAAARTEQMAFGETA